MALFQHNNILLQFHFVLIRLWLKSLLDERKISKLNLFLPLFSLTLLNSIRLQYFYDVTTLQKFASHIFLVPSDLLSQYSQFLLFNFIVFLILCALIKFHSVIQLAFSMLYLLYVVDSVYVTFVIKRFFIYLIRIFILLVLDIHLIVSLTQLVSTTYISLAWLAFFRSFACLHI